MEKVITLAHGAGGAQTASLIGSIFKKYLDNPDFTGDDAAVLQAPKGKMAMSTDGFVVSPSFFPGGNIGELSVCGTVNDLSCMGAKPQYMTCSFQIEEGFEIEKLEKIVQSMQEIAHKVGVHFVAGDTKVVGKGQVDGLFITTTGVGEIQPGIQVSGANAKAGDKILVTGDIGRHGCTILLARNHFSIQADITSDCQELWHTVEAMIATTTDLHCIRDATRGGVGTVLYEIAAESQVGIRLYQDQIPVMDSVKGVCGFLGLEPLYLACEGRMVVVVPAQQAKAILAVLKEKNEMAAVIGEVTEENVGKVVVHTPFGAQTILPQPTGELLPRIC